MLQNGWSVLPLEKREETPWNLMAAIAQAAFEVSSPLTDDDREFDSLDEAFDALAEASERGHALPNVHADYRPWDRLSLADVQDSRSPSGGLMILFAKGRMVMLEISTSPTRPGLLIINDELLRVAYGEEAEAKRDEILERAQLILNRMERVAHA